MKTGAKAIVNKPEILASLLMKLNVLMTAQPIKEEGAKISLPDDGANNIDKPEYISKMAAVPSGRKGKKQSKYLRRML